MVTGGVLAAAGGALAIAAGTEDCGPRERLDFCPVTKTSGLMVGAVVATIGLALLVGTALHSDAPHVPTPDPSPSASAPPVAAPAPAMEPEPARW